MSDIHVWLIRTRPGAPAPGQWALLDDFERNRAGRFQFAKDRDNYVVAHAWLRTLLASVTGLPIDRLSIVQADFQKPRLRRDDGGPKTFFNLSHTDGYVAIAVSNHCEVGIDVERIRPWPEVASFANSVLHPREVSILSKLPADECNDYFFRLWCAKEAYTKATGLGLSHPFDSFDVGIDAAVDDWIEAWPLTVPGFASARLRSSTVSGSHVVALAALSSDADATLEII